MDRRVMDSFLEWKHRKNRKPMILRGARQVGKTWLMKEFGKNCFTHVIYLRMDKEKRWKKLFSEENSLKEIFAEIERETETPLIPGETLLLLDEIQEVPETFSLLRRVSEAEGDYHLMAAGSLLGLQIHEGISFPVGQVEFTDICPLDFLEFLQACGEKRMSDMLMENHPEIFGNFRDRYMDFLRFYYYVGGMPEAVLCFHETRDMRKVRAVQENLLYSYESDFSKHMSSEMAAQAKALWHSIPKRLMQSVEGKKRKNMEEAEQSQALQWLIDSGLVVQVHPLNGRETARLYLLDVGLLGAMTGLHARTVVYGNRLFSEFDGILTRQYVFQQLKAGKENQIYYWISDTSMGELDFVLCHEDVRIPVEIRTNQKKTTFARALKAYCNKYRPEYAIRTSEAEYEKKDWMVNLPLYGIGNWKNCIEI